MKWITATMKGELQRIGENIRRGHFDQSANTERVLYFGCVFGNQSGKFISEKENRRRNIRLHFFVSLWESAAQRPMSKEEKTNAAQLNDDTFIVKALVRLFKLCSPYVAKYPLTFIIVTIVVSLSLSSSILFTPLSNEPTDFTPTNARALVEVEQYQQFFGNRGRPFEFTVIVVAKDGGSMLRLDLLNDTVQLLDTVTKEIPLHSSGTGQSLVFSQYCSSFCSLNEPVRYVLEGMKMMRDYGWNSSSSVDIGYPWTTIFSRPFPVDLSFFGVEIVRFLRLKVQIRDENGIETTVNISEIPTKNGHSALDNNKLRISNNLKSVKVVALHFRAALPNGVTIADRNRYDRDILHVLISNLSTSSITAYLSSTTYIASELVHAGIVLIPYIAVGFIVMCCFATVAISINCFLTSELNLYVLVVSLGACCCPLLATGTAMGLLFWLGARFGTLLNVTPFLVLAVGVDDAFLIISAFRRVTVECREQQNNAKPLDDTSDLSRRIQMVLEESGPSITITSMTNVLAFAIGSLTPTPEIRIFCISNTLAMFVTYVYQMTFVLPVIALTEKQAQPKQTERTATSKRMIKHANIAGKAFERLITKYCSLLCSRMFCLFAVLGLFVYWAISIYYISRMRPELSPATLFTKDSRAKMALHLSDNVINPSYSICFVLVMHPGDLTDPKRVMRLRQIVDDFERLPSSLGEFSTKFWLRDYDAYIAASNNDESELQELTNNTLGELITPLNSSITRGITANDIQEFLDWPEYEFWNGFLQFIQDESGETKLDKFFFTTAFHGVQLHRWSARSALKAQWRRIADMYPDLGVSIYQDHGIFLDVIPSILPQALQSTFFTLLCMIVVCLLVFVSLDEVVVAAISIVSICIGVCGYLSFCGVNLDPIVMSAMIMSIGFSVDIPAHIIYHFYKIPGTNVEARLERCLQMLIMPVLQAALSTDLCVLSLLVADVPMTWSFVQTVICVITLGLIHGIVVIPVVFYLYSLLPRRRRREAHLARIAPFTVTIDPNVDKSQTQITSPSV